MSEADRSEAQEPARRGRRVFTAARKVELVAEYEALPRGERGAWLREHGLYESYIQRWRDGRPLRSKNKPVDSAARRLSELEAENQRLREKTGLQ